MFRRIDGILIVLVLIVILWRWNEHRRNIPESPVGASVTENRVVREGKAVSSPTSKPPSEPLKISPPVARTIVAETSVSKESRPGPRPPPKGMIEFEVKENDLAIAYGDVVLGKVSADKKIEKGITAAQRSKLWETAEIPYSIDKGIANTAPILEAIEIYQNQTSIRFVPYNGQKDSVVFVPAQEICASYLGRVGGAQPIFISEQCGSGEIMHEIMHALGFVHEHSRPDRDKYVEVLWPNIDQKFWPQFYMVPDEQVHEYVGSVFSFDPESIMLYDSTAFAKETGLQTLRPRNAVELKPSRRAFSRIDRERLFYLYGQ